jgi:hypothetical protein
LVASGHLPACRSRRMLGLPNLHLYGASSLALAGSLREEEEG